MSHKQTPSQTVGPYFAYCLTPQQYGYAFKELQAVNALGEERLRLLPFRQLAVTQEAHGNPMPDLHCLALEIQIEHLHGEIQSLRRQDRDRKSVREVDVQLAL